MWGTNCGNIQWEQPLVGVPRGRRGWRDLPEQQARSRIDLPGQPEAQSVSHDAKRRKASRYSLGWILHLTFYNGSFELSAAYLLHIALDTPSASSGSV